MHVTLGSLPRSENQLIIMKVIALTCFCIALMALHVQAEEPTSTEAPAMCNLVCPKPLPAETVLKPHPDNCEQYCQCDPRGAILRECPVYNKETGERLHFNPNTLVCDWPDVAGCE